MEAPATWRDTWRTLRQGLAGAGTFGARTTPSADLYGQTPHIAPEAYLHELYRGLDASELSQHARSLSLPFPPEFGWLLSEANGLSLFSGSLHLSGVPRSRSRTGEDVWQPFDLLRQNTIERPSSLPHDLLIVGGYGKDGSHLVQSSRTGSVYHYSKAWAAQLGSWRSLIDMLGAEIARLSPFFSHGRFSGTGRRAPPPSWDN